MPAARVAGFFYCYALNYPHRLTIARFKGHELGGLFRNLRKLQCASARPLTTPFRRPIVFEQ